MKWTMIMIGSGIFMGAVCFFTMSDAIADCEAGKWYVSLELESIEVDGKVVSEYQIENVPWPVEARTEVYSGRELSNFDSHGTVEKDMCFEFQGY